MAEVTEFLSALCLLPLCYSDLRMWVQPLPCCSDASEAGGGICEAVDLAPSGRRKARRLRAPVEQRKRE